MGGPDYYASGVLFPEHHDRLVANIDKYALDAGINKRWIWTPLTEVCGPEEIAYVKAFNRYRSSGDVQGLCFIQASYSQVDQRMYAIAGALTRNFIRARVMTVGSVLDAINSGNTPDATCLLIPNFFLSASQGGTIASWQIAKLFDLLAGRAAMQQQTIVYASNLKDLATQYGAAFRATIDANFLQIQI